MKDIYFDNNATTKTRHEVVAEMTPYFEALYGNPSSIHGIGQKAKKALEDSREKIAKILNAASPSEIIFTASGTESNNTAIKGTAFANRKNGNHIITTSIEHHAVLHTCEYLEKEHGFEITHIPVDNYGVISMEELKNAVRERTILISVMHANNEIGTIQPVREIADFISRANSSRAGRGLGKIYFHTDAVQTVGKIKIDLEETKVDMLSFSAHKFYGPKGVGCLYVKEGVGFHPLLHGGHHELGHRASTENLPGIVGMTKALDLAVAEIEEENKKLRRLRERMEKEIIEKIPFSRINGHPTERLAGTSNIGFEFIEGESLVVSLDMAGIACSTGSACASGSTEPSHVIKAIACPPNFAQGAVRFSLGRYNSEREVDYLLKILPSIVEKLRSISPLYKKR